MSKEIKADADPKEPKENFEDLVGTEQSAKESSDAPKEGEQSDKKPDAAGEKPEEKSGETPGEEEKVLKAKRQKKAGNLKAKNSSGTSLRMKATPRNLMTKPREKLSSRARS